MEGEAAYNAVEELEDVICLPFEEALELRQPDLPALVEEDRRQHLGVVRELRELLALYVAGTPAG